MRAAHKETLRAIYRIPASGTIKWRDIESLFLALGGELSEGAGSRVRVRLSGRIAVFHRPHPKPDTDKGAVKSVRRFLDEVGIRP